MYDAVAEAVPMAQSGQNRKKAVVIISDGNDTSSRVGVVEVKQLVRETEVLVYAVGIDGQGAADVPAADAADAAAAAAPADSVPVSRRRRRGVAAASRCPAAAAAIRRRRRRAAALFGRRPTIA